MADVLQPNEIKPQPGAQYNFLASQADITIGGGSAGSGKSFALLIQPLYFIDIPDFRCTIFRTNSTDFRKSGGLWDEAKKVYPLVGGRLREGFLDCIFESGAVVKMHGIKDGDMHEWQSTQIPLIEYEELTHHSEKLFFYMLSRNRSTCGVRPFVRAACNPQYGSWVAKLIDWWIGEDGFPIKERSGVLRWFVRLKDQMYWADNRQDLINDFGTQIQPKSLTFIPARIYDNKILMERDPGYLSNLMALSEFDQQQLLYGNWKVRPSSGTYFKKSKVEIVDCLPAEILDRRRAWDRAATEPNPDNPNPDWTAGVKMERGENNYAWISDVVRMRGNPFTVEQTILNTASQDNRNVKIIITQDPGQAGVTEVSFMTRKLAGYNYEIVREVTDKLTKFKPFSSHALAGNVKLLRGKWNEEYLNELESFTGIDTDVDDQVDATSNAFNSLFNDITPKIRFIG